MSKWQTIALGKAIDFNPKEVLKKGIIAKKIPMGQLEVFERRINGYEMSRYTSGPKFRNNDTLVAKITPSLENGKTAQVNLLDDEEVAFGSSEFIVLRSNKYTTDDFVFYLAKSPTFREKAISCMEGTSGRRRVNENVLKAQNIKLPDLRTQQSIAKILSDLDSKIELNNQINQELEAMAKTLYDYWFVQFDFPNEEGKPYKSSGGKMVYNEELKREVPEGWEVVSLNEIESNIVTGKTPPTKEPKNFNGDIPFICIGDVRGNMHVTKTEMTLSKMGAETQANKYIPKGSICVTCIATPGLVAFASKESQTNQQLNSVVCEIFEHQYYLYFYLKDYFKFAKAKTGNTFANMNKGDFSSIKVIKPKIDVLSKFASNIKPSIENILLNSQENINLAELRDWLLPMLMNGQVTVKSVEVAEEELGEELGMVAEERVEY